MTFQVTLGRDENGMWCVGCPAIPGCFSQGTTREEALENIKDAIKLCLAVRAELGMPLTVETQQGGSSGPSCVIDLMDRMGREAEAHGMTPEILESILKDGG